MFARVARFSVDDPAKIDGEIETTLRYTATDDYPTGYRQTAFLCWSTGREDGCRGVAVR